MAAKILVPIDFSPASDAALAWASSLARDRKASLILLHVQEPIADTFVGEMYIPFPPAENPAVRKKLMKVKPDDPTVIYEHRLMLGSAPDDILKLAEEKHVELIVMGSHGRGWLGRVMMGSVAEHVMRHATCPVLIVKEPCTVPAEHGAQDVVAGS